MFKVSWFFILTLLLNISCTKDYPAGKDDPIRKDDPKTYSSTIRFDITNRLLEGKKINCIETDSKGNTWISSDKVLYHKNGSDLKTYTLDFSILGFAIAADETLWIGTNGGGIGHLTRRGITWYTVANAGLPRDYIRNVEVGLDGKVWFSSCAFDLGGLVVYDGKIFEVFTPENSPLNQNVVEDIEIDHDGSVYIVTSGKVGRTNIYRISDKSWDCLGDKNGTFYWVSVSTVGPAGIIYLVEDFSLSSSSINSNSLFEYRDDNWQKIETDFISRLSPFTSIKADKRNYCWLAGFRGNSPVLHVYNGESWEDSPEGIFPDDFITTIEADSDNNIWVGTAHNGVFVLNQ
jgi:ligand-binding sensor domain-containing protein